MPWIAHSLLIHVMSTHLSPGDLCAHQLLSICDYLVISWTLTIDPIIMIFVVGSCFFFYCSDLFFAS